MDGLSERSNAAFERSLSQMLQKFSKCFKDLQRMCFRMFPDKKGARGGLPGSRHPRHRHWRCGKISEWSRAAHQMQSDIGVTVGRNSKM